MSDLTWLAIVLGPLGFTVGCLIAVLLVSAWFSPRETEDEPVPKTPWEDRVRMLLNKPEIVWYYKAPDGKMYGGQPRLDFVACDIFGRFIMVEVKSLPNSAQSFSPNLLVPTVQRDALNMVAGTASGVAILAVGHENILRLYNWGTIRDRSRISIEGTQSEGTFWMEVWRGPSSWTQHNLHVILAKHWHPEPGPYSGLGPLANVISSGAWTKPYPALTVPESSPLILPPSMMPRPIASTRDGFEAMMHTAYEAGYLPSLPETKAEIYKKLAAMARTEAEKQAASQGATRPILEPIQNPVVKRAKPVPSAPPPEKTSGEKRKEILKKVNRQHHARQ